jgi:hypothetical protein
LFSLLGGLEDLEFDAFEFLFAVGFGSGLFLLLLELSIPRSFFARHLFILAGFLFSGKSRCARARNLACPRGGVGCVGCRGWRSGRLGGSRTETNGEAQAQAQDTAREGSR